jgi:hypothetical protein
MELNKAASKTRVRLALLVLLASASAPAPHALALSECYSDAVGNWRGPVLNGLRIQQMSTSFTLGADGKLVGRYHVDDAVPFDGTLTDFRETGRCSAEFRWRDRDGSGTVNIHFQSELGRFLGRWGLDRPAPGNVFNGYRRPPAVS